LDVLFADECTAEEQLSENPEEERDGNDLIVDQGTQFIIRVKSSVRQRTQK
jgi:hypothetical protein